MGSKFGNIMRGLLGGRSEPTSPALDSKNAVEYKGCLIHPASSPRVSMVKRPSINSFAPMFMSPRKTPTPAPF